jgi:hypothetical protein
MRSREFMALPIVAVVLGVIFLILLTAEAGVWGWILFGIGALVALVLVAAAMGRRHQHPSALDAPVTRAPARRDGTFRVLVVSDGSSTSQAFRDRVVAQAAGRPVEVLVVAPALESRLAHWTGDDQGRQQAEGNLEKTVGALADAGVVTRGRSARTIRSRRLTTRSGSSRRTRSSWPRTPRRRPTGRNGESSRSRNGATTFP